MDGTIHDPWSERMVDERRYGENEVAEIFEAAASSRGPRGRAVATSEGFSLAELQAIGAEAGIAPERIADAATALELKRGAAPRRTQLGIPVGVGRTVDLPRPPTDGEWELLVAELRQTFGAHGKDRSAGGVRAWTNGNLHAYVEPTPGGHRLRLGTTKGDSAAMTLAGIMAILTSLIMMINVELSEGGAMALLIALVGIAMIAFNALRLPRWASEREEQMEHIAARALVLIPPAPPPPYAV
jgi:hypothetical protein